MIEIYLPAKLYHAWPWIVFLSATLSIVTFNSTKGSLIVIQAICVIALYGYSAFIVWLRTRYHEI